MIIKWDANERLSHDMTRFPGDWTENSVCGPRDLFTGLLELGIWYRDQGLC